MLDIRKTRENLGRIEVSDNLERFTRDIFSAFDTTDEPLVVKQILNGCIDFAVQESKDNAPVFFLKIVDHHLVVI